MNKKLLLNVGCLTALLALSPISWATQQNIACIQAMAPLEQNFAQHWQLLPHNHYYLSAITAPPFSGALHTLTANLPKDPSPHLAFKEIKVKNIPHYGIWHIDCRYRIGNPLLQDLADGYLHMTTQIDNSQYRCKKLNGFTAQCDSK